MLDQLRRLVNGSSGGQTDGIPPSGSARQSRYQQQHGHSSGGSTRSGSLSRLTAYALHPQHSGRMRMQLSYNVVPVSYVAPPHPVAVAYGRNGRTAVVGYDPWFQVRYPQQPRTPVGRQLSARPDLAPPPQQPHPPPPPSSHSSGKKKSVGSKHSELSKEEFRHPTIRRETVVPNNRHRLVPSRSLDSIHPHRIHHHRQEKQQSVTEAEVKSSGKKMKEFFQRVKDSVSNSATTNGGHQSNGSSGGGQGQRTDEWLLHRPSVNANSSKPVPPPPLQRPTTPGMTAFRKIFSRSPSPTPPVPSGPLVPPPSHPIKKPLSSTKSLFQQIIRPRSRSVSSTTSLSVNSAAHSGGAIRHFNRMMKEKSKTDLNIVHRNDAGSIRRGNPDGATFPRDSPFHLAGTESSDLLIYAPASEPAISSSVMTTTSNNSNNNNNNNSNNKNPSKKTKFVKKIEQPVAGFRVKRRQSQLRRSERKRRSSRHRSGRKKSSRNSSSGSKKLGSSKGSQLGSQSALSGAKLVSDWTYLPLPTSFTPVEEAKPRTASLKIVCDPPETKSTPPTAISNEEDDDNGWESDLYQVLVDRGQPRRSGPLPPPMWDPLIFIPPERRRSSAATITLNESAILVADQQPWIRSSKLRADGKKQLRRINPPPPPPPLSPSSSRSSSGTQLFLPPHLLLAYQDPPNPQKCRDTLHLPQL